VPDLNRQCRAEVLVGGASPRAFGTCEHRDDQSNEQHDRLAFYELTRDGWNGRVLSVLGRPLATAQDRTGTYVLLELHQGYERKAALVRRDPHGRYTTRVLSAEGYVGSGALVARAGKWWAVWTCVRGAGRGYSLCEAGTLFGATPPQRITDEAAGDFAPSMALRTDGRLDLMWSRSTQTLEGSDEELWIARRDAVGWSARRLRARPNASFYGRLAGDGRHRFATWIQNSRPVIASDESGSWVVHELLTRSCANSAGLAVSGDTVTLVVGQCAEGDAEEGPQGSAVVVLERREGRWTTSSLDRRTSQTGLRSVDVASHHGDATVLLATSDFAVTQTRTQNG
jgi:hypothetical protein